MVPDFANDEAFFDYKAAPKVARKWLKGAADKIRQLTIRGVYDVIQIGELLHKAHEQLKGSKRRAGNFCSWVAAEFPFSVRTAARYVSVYHTFGHLVFAEDAAINKEALYVLTQFDVPAQAREYALELAGERRVTKDDALAIVSAHKTVPDLSQSELTSHDRRMQGIRRGESEERKKVTDYDPDLVMRAWIAFDALVKSGGLHVVPIADTEDVPLYSVTVYRGQRPQSMVRRALADAVLAAAGEEPTKYCPRCKLTKFVSLFGANEANPDARSRCCRECERPRIVEVKKRKREV